jgi:hypothetical protein
VLGAGNDDFEIVVYIISNYDFEINIYIVGYYHQLVLLRVLSGDS